MTVELDYTKLTRAAGRAEGLASSIRTQATAARSASPIALPSLEGIEQKATYLEEQADVLYGLADLAVLLDDSGQVDLPVADVRDKLGELLGSYLLAEFGNNFGFGDDDDFPLIAVATGLMKMKKISQGVAPIAQTSKLNIKMYEKLMARGGRAGKWAEWMLSGGAKHQAPPKSLLKAPKWMVGKTLPDGSFVKGKMPAAGWADPLAKGAKGGLAAMRGLGIVGGVASTGMGAYDLYQQGNPVEAFEREGAGYVADVAETAFSASSTAFLIAPNPVTATLAVGSGLVWAGAEVVDNWDDISERASDLGEAASKAWDKVTPW
ncbi:hypothetical protein AFL01nite_11300 [Aeromicrobium flavum]|uniref:Uncharacterized protein n=1 Tax=Aeromicrobium flavum TaxID=416568 RepID=A0A512HTM3_9ACTN|nr:hypothetical protein [Aeromicrobium flavum]GEO88803.1 hypothetical protein AFL01nite_11300 [Aeromicrobium flavum]